jgi:RNA polymerase sporulation-specific sigma factor
LKAFEKPLTAAEEKECFEKYKNGDKDACDRIIWHNMRLVAHMAKRYANSGYEMDDLISTGTLGLIKAVRSFDTEKGSKFATYAAKCIDNEILMMLRSEKKRQREISIYEPIGTDKEGNEISLLEIMVSKNRDILQLVELNDDIKWLKKAFFSELNEREQQIVALRYGFTALGELTQREISEMLGISRSYVSRIEKKALEKLKENREDGCEGKTE